LKTTVMLLKARRRVRPCSRCEASGCSIHRCSNPTRYRAGPGLPGRGRAGSPEGACLQPPTRPRSRPILRRKRGRVQPRPTRNFRVCSAISAGGAACSAASPSVVSAAAKALYPAFLDRGDHGVDGGQRRNVLDRSPVAGKVDGPRKHPGDLLLVGPLDDKGTVPRAQFAQVIPLMGKVTLRSAMTNVPSVSSRVVDLPERRLDGFQGGGRVPLHRDLLCSRITLHPGDPADLFQLSFDGHDTVSATYGRHKNCFPFHVVSPRDVQEQAGLASSASFLRCTAAAPERTPDLGAAHELYVILEHRAALFNFPGRKGPAESTFPRVRAHLPPSLLRKGGEVMLHPQSGWHQEAPSKGASHRGENNSSPL
jgi:hypothetical protein